METLDIQVSDRDRLSIQKLKKLKSLSINEVIELKEAVLKNLWDGLNSRNSKRRDRFTLSIMQYLFPQIREHRGLINERITVIFQNIKNENNLNLNDSGDNNNISEKPAESDG